jgi:hypothetical protein
VFRRRPEPEPVESCWLEPLVLPNGLFIIVLSGVGLDESDFVGLDGIREQTGAAGVLISRRPLMLGPLT